MYKILLPIVLLAMACNTSNNPQPAVAVAPGQPSPVPVSTEPENYFHAAGAGWTLDMKAAMDGTFPVVIIENNGQDTLVGSFSKAGLYDRDGKQAVGSAEVRFTGILEGKETGESAEITINSAGCSDASGAKHLATCTANWGKRTLSDCGDYSE